MSEREPVRPLLLGLGWPPDQFGGLNTYFRDLLVRLPEAEGIVAGPVADAPAQLTAVGDGAESLIARLRAITAATRAHATGTDVVDVHFALYGAIPVLIGALRRLPLVVHFQGSWADEAGIEGAPRRSVAVRRAIERRVYRKATRAVTLSGAFARVLIERYHVSPWGVTIVRPGVDTARFQPGDRLAARQALGIDPDAWVAVAVRRLVVRTGVEVLIDAWAELVESSKKDAPGARPLELVVAGDGPEHGRLLERARTRPGGARVRFLGSIPPDELELLYRAADVCVVPSTALEGFGLVVLEALACGTPVIVTDSGGLPEAVDDLDPGLVVARNDPAALRDRLRAALNGSAPLPDADRCRAVAESFDWPSAVARHRAIYAEAATQPQRRPRVLFVDHCAQLSGAEIAMLRLLRAFSAVDAHVVLFEDGPLAVRLGSSAITSEVVVLAERTRALRRTRTNTVPSPRVLFDAGAHVFKLARRIRAVRPDVVHANSLKACLIAGVAARLTRVPCIWHVHDRIEADYLPRRAVALVRFLARRLPTVVVANSHATLASLRLEAEHGPAGVVVSGSVPTEFFAAASPSTPERVPRSAVVVGMVGRLAPWKGQAVFLDAFARAFPDGDVRARVIGDALFGEEDYAAGLQASARTLGIADRVEFKGFCHDVPAELAALDVLVHASVIPEPFGQVVVEGMAAGLPVIASDAGGPAEVISPELDGLLVAPGDVEGLAAALRRLANDDALRHRLGRAARLRAAEFRSDATASRMEAIYRELLGANA